MTDLSFAPRGSKAEIEEGDRLSPKFDADGLVTAVTVDADDGMMRQVFTNLLKNAGDVVKSGEAISTVGNSGGQDTAALYFAIRQQGRPSDPTQWCRAQG